MTVRTHTATGSNVDTQLLNILVCPVTGAALRHLEAEELTQLNKRIEAGEAFHADDSVVNERLEAGLITADDHTIYPVDDGIPMMLPEYGISHD